METLASCAAFGPITLALHAASDLVLFVSLIAVAVAIIIYVQTKQPEFRVGGLVAAGFIIWIGLLYFGSFLSLWYPIHLVLGVMKALTALVVMITSIALFPLMSKFLEIFTPQEYETVINQLYEANVAMKKLVAEKVNESKKITAELNNRVRNVLATVHGVSKETARSSKDIPAYLNNFNARMIGLASCNELLLSNGWKGAKLKDVINSQLNQYTDLDASIEGPEIFINPVAVQNISLAVHELASNNATHTNGGSKTCTITWQKHQDEHDNNANDTLKLVWDETGATIPNSNYKGFGHSVLDYIVPTSLNGMSELRISGNVVRWNLEVPINNVIV